MKGKMTVTSPAHVASNKTTVVGAEQAKGGTRGAKPSPASPPIRPSRQWSWIPYLLSLPGIAVCAAFLLVPLAATALLSLNSFSFYGGIADVWKLDNYIDTLTDSYFHEIFLRTFRIAALVTLSCAALGTPQAYILRRMGAPWRSLCLLIVLGPLLISVVSRTLGWALLLGPTGLVNQGLLALGLVSQPVEFMYTETGVVIALVHVLVPFMVLSVWASLQRLDPQVENAALSLGASPTTVLRRIVFPQIMPGILSGSIIVFALAASAFATPAIIGGRRLKVAATLTYDEFLNTLNWPLGAAVAMLLLVANIVIIVGCNRLVERRYKQVFE
ncbi:ABC transporter permease [Azospirillum picis]|uniref:Spermidine/putrescine transport system permease protein n=1 Tax=Azospirillum picis TaxID=488438 RepID=A0ABU0MMD5_9PROT|nr:ABC transporter permease [Azospirillum picis]MBP2300666.1 putative spermidine/putrescine transport system permease protein [Azospirillum picis]MDQ0534635.1 putative spermidine/putrescine transport system permease protein [Azospirillum picis]